MIKKNPSTNNTAMHELEQLFLASLPASGEKNSSPADSDAQALLAKKRFKENHPELFEAQA